MGVKVGTLLFSTGVIHQLVGVVELWDELVAVWHEGIFGAVTIDHPMRMAGFWFFALGMAMLALGALYRHIEGTLQRPLPTSAGWWLLALALFVIVQLPASGAWLLLPQVALIFWRARESRKDIAATAAR